MVVAKMVMTTIRVDTCTAENTSEMLNWLQENISQLTRHYWMGGGVTRFVEAGWEGNRIQISHTWSMTVTFDDPKHTTLFTLRWK